jgi:uncharacterized membrane protein YkoI
MAPIRRCLVAVLLFVAVRPAVAADPPACLNQDQRRAAVASHRAIPLARAVRDIRRRAAGAEVVGARLCYLGSDLVYMLTVLARDGKVVHASVNAASGVIIDGH